MATKAMNRPSKVVVDRKRSCRAVLWALETHGEQLVERLEARLGGHAEEGTTMPFASLLEILKKDLVAARERLVDLDRTLRDERVEDDEQRELRDRALEELSDGVIALREAFRSTYGTEKLGVFGFAIQTPRLPEELLEQATHLVTRLSDPEIELPEPRFPGLGVDPATMAATLEPMTERVREAFEGVSRETRETESLKVAKDRALAEYNASFLWIARTVESLFRLAGLEELADRVRPSARRPGTTETEFEEPEEPTGNEEEPPEASPAGPG